MTAQTLFSPETFWIVDGGTSHHMVPTVDQLDSITPYTSADQVSIGNGACLHIAHIGHTNLSSGTSKLHLHNVFHVP